MSLLAPVAAAFGLVIPAIVALYFLRVRRPQVPVSSTLLWRSMIKDRQANVPWQRLRFSWLLVLQVLAAMAIVLALMRPAHSAPAPLAAHTIIMVDASAPMRAIDVAPSRFAEAKKRASQIIGRMGAQDRVTLMELSAQPKVLASAVGDRNALRQALGRLSPDNAPADLQQALALAASVSGSGTDTELVLLSDGITDPLQAPVSLPFRLTYQVVGTSGENVAITALSAQPGPSGQVGFVHVQNFGTKHHDTTLDWSVDGKLLNAKALSLDGGAGTDLTFALPAGAQRLAASLTPGDTLALDDAAWGLARPSAGYRALLVSPGGNLFLQQALRLLPGLQLTGVTSTADAAQPADLYIYDRFLPPSLPNAPLLIVDPPTSTVLPTGQAFSPGALQPAAADPLLADLNLTDVHVAAARDLSHANFGHALITRHPARRRGHRRRSRRGVGPGGVRRHAAAWHLRGGPHGRGPPPGAVPFLRQHVLPPDLGHRTGRAPQPRRQRARGPGRQRSHAAPGMVAVGGGSGPAPAQHRVGGVPPWPLASAIPPSWLPDCWRRWRRSSSGC